MQKIGDYQIIEKVGQGGMATVYRGMQTSLKRPVAIKVLSKKLTENKKIVERFDREAVIIAKLSHPNIIHIIDRGITNGMHFFVMDFVDGSGFDRIINGGKFDIKKKMDIVIQVCKGLSCAHKNGVIHRDIKPNNILIDGENNAMISDFGIAQLFGSQVVDEQLTEEGAVMGTVAYMSPEQKTDSGKVTAATDIYSLGVIMYEMFTGVKPMGIFKPPSDVKPDFPGPLEEIILKCLETDPKNRFKSADEMKDRLLGFLQGSHIEKSQKEQVFRGLKTLEDKFALLDIIKENKFGAVYLFENKKNRELMIIKKVKEQESGLAESKILGKLSHKNIVGIYGVSGDKRLFIIVMEYISAGSLKERLLKPYPWVKGLKIAKDICDGLSFAYKNNVIHGDLRPSNIMIAETGEVKISDFGLEKHYPAEEGENNWYSPSGGPKSFSSDIFSAGVIFYEMLTGSLPVRREGKLVHNDRFDTLPREVQTMIASMISPNEKDRYDGFDKVGTIIDEILQKPRRKKKKKKKRISRTLLFLLAVSLLLYFIAQFL